jgi:hypothetical protein
MESKLTKAKEQLELFKKEALKKKSGSKTNKPVKKAQVIEI